jgi:hypothetical protein
MYKVILETETLVLPSKWELILFLRGMGLAPWYINARLVYLARNGRTFLDEGDIFALA